MKLINSVQDDLRQFEQLSLSTKVFENPVSVPSNGFPVFVLQNEEKSQSEVSVNTPTALPSSFICSARRWPDLLKLGLVFTLVSSYLCSFL